VIWRADYRQVVRFNWNNHSWIPTKWKFAVLELWLTHALLPLHKLYTGKFLPLIFAVLLLWYNSMHVSIFMCVFFKLQVLIFLSIFVVCTERRRIIFLCKWDELVFNSRYRLSVVLHFTIWTESIQIQLCPTPRVGWLSSFERIFSRFQMLRRLVTRTLQMRAPTVIFFGEIWGNFPISPKTRDEAKNAIGDIKITPYPRAVHLMVLRSKD